MRNEAFATVGRGEPGHCLHLDTRGRKQGDLSDGTRHGDDDVERPEIVFFLQPALPLLGEEQGRRQGPALPSRHDGILHVSGAKQARHDPRRRPEDIGHRADIGGFVIPCHEATCVRQSRADLRNTLQPFDLQRWVQSNKPINLGAQRLAPRFLGDEFVVSLCELAYRDIPSLGAGQE